MLQLIPTNPGIDFSGKFKMAVLGSFLAIFASITLVVVKGLNYGVDFRGGAEIQVKFLQTVDLGALRDVLEEAGLDSPSVQSVGRPEENEFLLKVHVEGHALNEMTAKISNALKAKFASSSPDIRRTDIVGPKAGKELRLAGFKAMFYALLAIMVYIGLRFDFRYGPGAIWATFHDIIIIIGVFALTGKEFSLQTVAALLAVIGYSVNDTVVVYDRIREHEHSGPGIPLLQHMNLAINETLSRTLLTSSATLLVSATLMFLGGDSIKGFFFAMSIGIVVGTYSSIFLAAPITLFFDGLKKRSAPKVVVART